MASGGAGTAEVVLLSGPLVRHTPVAGAGHLLAAGGRLRGGAGAVQVRRVYGIAFEIAFSPAQDTDTLFTSFCSYKCCCCSVMTDPQELWVGPQSQAAQEKAAYEVYPSDGLGHGRDAVKCIPAAPCSPPGGRRPAHPPPPTHPLQAAFGPFYRINQLILVTTPAANATFTAASGLPAIVTGTLQGGKCAVCRCLPLKDERLRLQPIPRMLVLCRCQHPPALW